MSDPRYLLVKAHVGFGDRLQCLSQAVHFATTHGRTLCIDWTDMIWSDGTLDFHTYFDLCGVPLISKAALLQQEFANVEPLAWANQIERPADSKFIFRPEYGCLLGEQDSPANLLVYAGTGYRAYYVANLCHLRVKRPIRNRIVAAVKTFSHFSTVVHLRGTDRVPREQYAGYLADCWARMGEVGRGEPLLVVADCLPLFQLFRMEFPAAVLRTPHLDGLDPLVGTHLQNNLDKHEANVEMLTDFFLLMYAERCFHDPQTEFSKMARFIRTGDYCSILGYDA